MLFLPQKVHKLSTQTPQMLPQAIFASTGEKTEPTRY
jgi:hypothetical protein